MIDKGNLLQTLHCHTNNSDGALTHREVLDTCSKNGIGVVAFTDHDTLPNEQQIKELQRLRGHPTKYIWGIEITSGYPKEAGHKEPNMFHIVGLFVNPRDKKLKELTIKTHRQRREKMKRRINEFRSLGFKVTEDEVFRTVSRNGIPTSLNLVNVLQSHPENKEVLDKFVKQMRVLSQKDKKVEQLYQEMLEDDRGDKQKYFNTFMKDESPLKIKLPEQVRPEMDTVVGLIRQAGGLAVLAHWTFDREKIKGPLLEKIVREGRLDGVETVYDLFLLDRPIWKRKLQNDRAFLRRIVKKYQIFASGGVDAHKSTDFPLFAARKDYNQETIGLVETIIRQRHPNLENSSL